MSLSYSSSAKAFAFGAVWLFITILVILLCENVNQTAALPARHDTTLGGMHYAVWTEPRTGDVYVVNITIDSLKALMFNNQIRKP